MSIILCYENFKIGELSYNGKEYVYKSLPDKDAFLKEYGYIDFDLADVDKKTYAEMPYFFAKYVDKILHNPEISSLLNINLLHDTYFDVLYLYATLPQTKNTFYFETKK